MVFRRAVLGGLIGLVGFVGAAGLVERAIAAEEKPDGTIHIESKSVALGVGISWGGGTLTFKDKTYPIKVDGLTVGSVGASSVNAEGTVYNLKKIEDFDGTYTAVQAGAAVGGGGGVLAMQNQNGVKVNLRATSQGIALTIGASGVKLAIEKK